MNEIAKKFKWRTQQNEWLLPSEMETRHLYYTLRMIYNHSMPSDVRLYPYKQYRFDPNIYTKEYITEAIRNLSYELATRNDIKEEWNLDLMKIFLNCTLDRSKLDERTAKNQSMVL